jgi:hypothetical protein
MSSTNGSVAGLTGSPRPPISQCWTDILPRSWPAPSHSTHANGSVRCSPSGDVLVAQRNLAAALDSYEASLAISERVASSLPVVRWLLRPEIPASEREITGKAPRPEPGRL